MQAALHLSHPYGRPVIGWAGEIRHIGRIEAQDFYTHHYAPNNAILVVAGDVTPAEVRSAAEAEYGKLPARDLVPRADYAQPPRLGPTRLTVTRPDAKLPLFERIYRVVSYTEAKPGEAEALDVLAQLMGGDATARSTSLWSSTRSSPPPPASPMTAIAATPDRSRSMPCPRPGVSLQRLEKAADAVIAHFRKTAAKPADLARARTQLVADATYQRDSQFALAMAYGRALVIGLTAEDVEEWPDRIGAVTAAAVRKVAQDQLVSSQSVTGYLLPKAAAKPHASVSKGAVK